MSQLTPQQLREQLRLLADSWVWHAAARTRDTAALPRTDVRATHASGYTEALEKAAADLQRFIAKWLPDQLAGHHQPPDSPTESSGYHQDC